MSFEQILLLSNEDSSHKENYVYWLQKYKLISYEDQYSCRPDFSLRMCVITCGNGNV